MEEDDEIWDYQSIKKVRRGDKSTDPPKAEAKTHPPAKQISGTSSDKRKRKIPTRDRKKQTTPQKKQTTPQKRNDISTKEAELKTIKTPMRPEGVCPSCQVPLSCLGVLSPSWHVTECIESGQQPSVECPNGLSCDNTIESHYKNYSHHRLALHRSTNPESAESPEEIKIARKELKFPEAFDEDQKRIPSVKETEAEIQDNVSDAESEDLLSQRSLSDILDAAHSDSDIDKVSDDESDEKSDDKDDGLVLSLLPDMEIDDRLPDVNQEATMCLSTEKDEMNEVRKLAVKDIFSDDDATLCFSSQDETDGEVRTRKQRDRKRTDMESSVADMTSLKDLAQAEKLEVKLFSSDENEQQDDLSEEKANCNSGLLNSEEVHYISDSDSDFQDCKDTASLSQKMQWARILTPQNCSQNSQSSGSSQKLSGRKSSSQSSASSKTPSVKKYKSLPQSSTSSSLTSLRKLGSSPAPTIASQRSSGKKRGLSQKSNSVRKKKDQSNTKPSLGRKQSINPMLLGCPSKGKQSESKGTTTQNMGGNKQTSLTSFFFGKNIGSSGPESSVITSTSNLSDSEFKSNHSTDGDCKLATPKGTKSSLNDVTNKVRGSEGPVSALVDIGVNRNPKAVTPKKSSNNSFSDTGLTCGVSEMCNGMTGSLMREPSTSKVMDSKSASKTDFNKPNAMTLLMSKQRKGQAKPIVEKSVREVKTSELTVPPAKNPPESKPNNYYNKRSCPFYKKIPDTGFTVDAFSYGVIPGCTGYILSHFHYDHYTGLTKSFSKPIYCSQITANLVISKIKVNKSWVHVLPLNKPTFVDGVELTFLEANHCPGSVLILFKLKNGRMFLHTGDFRADPGMEQYPALAGVRISQLYLDTTYCNPTYAFPSQREVIEFTVSMVQREVQKTPRTLIVCGSYTIGKERIFIAISEALNCKICVLRDKKNILDCLEDHSLRQKLSLNFNDSCLHVLPMTKLNPKALSEHSRKLTASYQNILALEPTGWTFSKISSLKDIQPKYNRDGIKIYGIPYSEHSSYLELQRFVQFIKPSKIIPTVNMGNPASRAKMAAIFKQWQEGTAKTLQKNTQMSISTWTK